ncbi:MAG: hypothetical protein OEL83_11605 [Desulforhopalus sp.]|nr:hypothetical protein [Desulforhopalus sp.]
MKDAKGLCLSCRFFHLQDTTVGICRIDKEMEIDYPRKKIDDQCSQWKNGGQQYFIRLGWIKAQRALANT